MSDTIESATPTPPSQARSAEKTHLLIVEDEPIIRQLFSTLLTAAGYSVSQAENGFAALDEVRRRRPALILSDLNMPRMTGFELLSVVRRRFPGIHVIAMSGAFEGDDIPNGVAAEAFYRKSGRHISTLVQVIEGILKDPSARATISDSPAPESSVALWVTQLGTPIEGPYILLTCAQCLRSFPHPIAHEGIMEVLETTCIFCAAPITFALLDTSITHHPGYAPSR